MALDLYLRLRHASYSHDSPEIAELSAFLGAMNRTDDAREATFRNENGVYMKLMNF